jgi:hypothetical protein
VGTLSFEQLKPIKVIEVLTTRRRFSSIRLAHADYDHFSKILSALHALRTTLDLKSKKKIITKGRIFFKQKCLQNNIERLGTFKQIF